MSNFNTFLPIQKVVEKSDGTCMVYARGTQEIPDKARPQEIMDYATTVPEIRKWSDEVYQRSGGQSYGNVRSMHSNIASGKLTEPPIYLDNEKAVDLVIEVIDPTEAKKCMSGVYTGMSLGGDYGKRWLDPEHNNMYRYTGVPKEWSLVDAPCVPSATFRMVKLDGSEELLKFVELEKTDPPITPNVSLPVNVEVISELDIDQGEEDVEIEKIPEKADENSINLIHNQNEGIPVDAVKAVTALVNSFVELKKLTIDENSRIEKELIAIGKSVGIPHKEGEPLHPPKGYPTNPDDYADPANWSWPIDKKERTHSAISYFNGGQGKDKYNDNEWNKIGRRIATRASSQFGVPYKYDPQKKEVSSTKEKKMEEGMLNKSDIAALLNQIMSAISVAADQLGSQSSMSSSYQQGTSNTAPLSTSSPSIPSSPNDPSSQSVSNSSTSKSTPSTSYGPPTQIDTFTSNAYSDLDKKVTAYGEKVDKLVEAIEKLTLSKKEGKLENNITPVPVSELAALANIQIKPVEEENPILKAFLSGPDGLSKAAKLAGSDEFPDYTAVYQLARREAYKAGKPIFAQIAAQNNVTNSPAPFQTKGK